MGFFEFGEDIFKEEYKDSLDRFTKRALNRAAKDINFLNKISDKIRSRIESIRKFNKIIDNIK